MTSDGKRLGVPDNKRYYWLKLERGFFKRHDMQILKSLSKGCDYVSIYLQLMTESIDHGGELRYSEEIPYTDETLAVVTGTPIVRFKKAMDIFIEKNLVEKSEAGTLLVTLVPDRIGKKTDSAVRMERSRAQKKDVDRHIVTESDAGERHIVQNSDGDVTESDKNVTQSKSKSKSKTEAQERARELSIVDTFEPPETDPVRDAYRAGVAEHLPAIAWPNTHKQYDALRELSTRTADLAPDSAIPDPCDFARAILRVFEHRKATERDRFWTGASWEPVTILRRFGTLVTDLSDGHSAEAEDSVKLESLRGMYATD